MLVKVKVELRLVLAEVLQVPGPFRVQAPSQMVPLQVQPVARVQAQEPLLPSVARPMYPLQPWVPLPTMVVVLLWDLPILDYFPHLWWMLL